MPDRLAVRLRHWWLLVELEEPGRQFRLPLGDHATALSAAMARAAHARADPPHVVYDPLAERLLPPELIPAVPAGGASLHVVTRSRTAEDAVDAAYGRGGRQYVVLGAGLDTFAYRREDLPGLRVFEVDTPAAQQWKRARLAAAGIARPRRATYVAVDFERDRLDERLAAEGWRPHEPTVFSWLGVTGYLTRRAIEDTLRVVAAAAPGSEVVFDYTDPAREDDFARMVRDLVELVGEPIRSVFQAAELAELVGSCGLELTSDVDGIARARVPDRLP